MFLFSHPPKVTREYEPELRRCYEGFLPTPSLGQAKIGSRIRQILREVSSERNSESLPTSRDIADQRRRQSWVFGDITCWPR